MPATWRWCARISRNSDRAGEGDAALESEVNARKGRYHRVALKSRFAGQHMPHIQAIDCCSMRRARSVIWPRLAEHIGIAMNGASRRCCFSIAAAMRR